MVATADLVWRAAARLTLSGGLRYESDRFDDDQNTRRIDGGTGVDARADLRISEGLGAFLAADNLFDDRLQTGRSAAGVVTYDAPTVVRVGLVLRR
jgi:outer membrane receptor protein involved in Fe transport